MKLLSLYVVWVWWCDIGCDNGDVIMIVCGVGVVVDIFVVLRDVCDVKGYDGVVENY